MFSRLIRLASVTALVLALLCGQKGGAGIKLEKVREDSKKPRSNPPPRLIGSAPAPRELSAKDLEAIWKDLGREDNDGVALAYQHVNAMVQSPTTSLPFLKERLKQVTPPDAGGIDQWIGDLDSNDFEAREKAMASLEKVGPLAAAALRKKRQAGPPLEVKRRIQQLLDKLNVQAVSADELRTARAVEVLFGINTLESRGVLEDLARGAPGARMTEEARRAVVALKPVPPR
jgi:hypothetical protein